MFADGVCTAQICLITSWGCHQIQAHIDNAGEELFLSYGSGFWEFQKDRFRAIKEERELEQV